MSNGQNRRLRGCLVAAAVVAVAVACAGAPKTPDQTSADEALAARVYATLNADPIDFYRHVDVSADGAVVYLSGYVWDTPAIYRAKHIASSVPGVQRVVDQLELEREGMRGGGHSGTG